MSKFTTKNNGESVRIREPVGSKKPKAPPYDLIDQIRSKEDFTEFLSALTYDAVHNKNEWQSWSLEDYLESTEAWVNDTDEQLYEENCSEARYWQSIAYIFYMGKIYE